MEAEELKRRLFQMLTGYNAGWLVGQLCLMVLMFDILAAFRAGFLDSVREGGAND